MSGNFKVICTRADESDKAFITVGKEYEFVDGRTVWDNGEKSKIFESSKKFIHNEYCRHRFELSIEYLKQMRIDNVISELYSKCESPEEMMDVYKRVVSESEKQLIIELSKCNDTPHTK